MTARWLAVVTLLIGTAGCFRDHPPGAVQTADNACATCHLHDYQATTTPVHPGRFPRTCGDCHYTTDWQPALEGPHAGTFRLDGAHQGIPCLECHDPENRGPSAGGVNTICALCHEHRDSHHRDPANPSGCFSCHRSGGED